MHVATGLCRSKIGKPEPISLNDIAYGHKDVATELWAPVTKRVKLPPFAAGVDTWGQFRQKSGVRCQPSPNSEASNSLCRSLRPSGLATCASISDV